MATEVTVRCTDDMYDGPPGGAPDAKTVRFAVEGTEYEIDLGVESMARFLEATGPFCSRARVVKGPPRQRSVLRTEAGRRYTAKVRRWGNEHGLDLGTGGRIPDDAYTAYDDAHPGERAAVEAKAARAGTPGPARPAAPAKRAPVPAVPAPDAAKPAVPQPRPAPAANGTPAKPTAPAASNGHHPKPSITEVRAWAKGKGAAWARQHKVKVSQRGPHLEPRLYELYAAEHAAT